MANSYADTRIFRDIFGRIQKFCDANRLPEDICAELRSHTLLKFNSREARSKHLPVQEFPLACSPAPCRGTVLTCEDARVDSAAEVAADSRDRPSFT